MTVNFLANFVAIMMHILELANLLVGGGGGAGEGILVPRANRGAGTQPQFLANFKRLVNFTA